MSVKKIVKNVWKFNNSLLQHENFVYKLKNYFKEYPTRPLDIGPDEQIKRTFLKYNILKLLKITLKRKKSKNTKFRKQNKSPRNKTINDDSIEMYNRIVQD